MDIENYVNADDVRRAIAILHPQHEPFEIRIIDSGDSNSKPLSGYFSDAETLLEKFKTVPLQGRNVYITLNQFDEACMSRTQHERFMKAKVTTSDPDIMEYHWLFIDLDPIRRSGISSSEAELKAAEKLAGQVYQYLKGLGFEEPVKAMSGNGCHLLYKIRLANTAENKQLIQNCLQTLADLFNNEQVSIDTTNYNPARICKLHGTLAQKGADTAERPHRFSRIFSGSPEVKANEKAFLEKLVAQLPHPEPQQRQTYTDSKPEFDLNDFLSKHGLTYQKVKGDQADIYRLDHCPFDSTHTNGDSKIFRYPNGAIAFKCHHNSCAGKKWQDVRQLFETDAYNKTYAQDDGHIEAGWQQHNRNKEPAQIEPPEPDDTEPRFRTMQEILASPDPQHEFVRCGIDGIDRSMGGLEKTGVSVISGLRASGKSTWIGQIILTAVQDQHTVVVYSGELDNHKYINWLMRQAAGKTNIVQSQTFRNSYDVPQEIKQQIAEWSSNYFWLYNNKYGNRFDKLEAFLRQQIISTKADICIIDNLMALDISALNSHDKYDAQTNFVWALKNLAEQTNTHIIFVAHPRKANGFLRLSDISGSGNIGNIVDNAFIIHRWNKDFENGYKEYFKTDPEKDIGKCTNVIEIAKDREGGQQDVFIPLYYEESTKRLRNDITEYITYGWVPDTDGSEGFQPAESEGSMTPFENEPIFD